MSIENVLQYVLCMQSASTQGLSIMDKIDFFHLKEDLKGRELKLNVLKCSFHLYFGVTLC